MAKRKPELILKVHIGGFFNDVEVEIWNDIRNASLSGNKVEVIRDNGEKTVVKSSDTDGIYKVYAVACAVIAGRNYGA